MRRSNPFFTARRCWIASLALAMTLEFSAPAHAAETAESYYGRLMKSCEYKVRETWRDYLMYAPNKRLDECCADSVKQMAALGVKLSFNKNCPENYQVNALRCTTSKQWCEPVKPQ